MAMGAPSACSIAGSRRVGTVARRAARSGIVVDRRTEACGTILLTVAAATNTRRSPTRMSSRRRPSTSQRRNPPNSMASTMARSRCVRSAPINSSTAAGDNTRGNVRGVRTTGTRRPLRPPRRRAARLRGTTLRRRPRHRALPCTRTDHEHSTAAGRQPAPTHPLAWACAGVESTTEQRAVCSACGTRR